MIFHSYIVFTVIKQEAWHYLEQGQGHKGQKAWQVKLKEINN